MEPTPRLRLWICPPLSRTRPGYSEESLSDFSQVRRLVFHPAAWLPDGEGRSGFDGRQRLAGLLPACEIVDVPGAVEIDGSGGLGGLRPGKQGRPSGGGRPRIPR